MHPTQHLKSHCHVQPAARASVSLSMTLQEHRARVRLQNLSQFRTFPCIVPPNRKAAIFSPTVREEPFLQPHIAESTTIPSQFRTFPCIVPPSQKTAARAALSAHCKAVAKAALKRAYRSHCTPRAAARAALSAQCKAVARAALKPAQRQPSPD